VKVCVGLIDLQITFWGPEKKVKGIITWLVFQNDLGAILKLQRPWLALGLGCYGQK